MQKIAVTISFPILIGLVIIAAIIGGIVGYRSRVGEQNNTIEHQRATLQKIREDLDDFVTPTVTEEDTRLLKSLPYSEYLRSDYWRRVRWAVFRDSDLRCRVCNCGGLLQAHHRDYSSIGKERMSDLICLCEACHKLFHENRILVREHYSDRLKDLHQQLIDKYLEAEAVFREENHQNSDAPALIQ